MNSPHASDDEEALRRFFTNWPSLTGPLIKSTKVAIMAHFEKVCRENPAVMVEEANWWQWRDPDALAAARAAAGLGQP